MAGEKIEQQYPYTLSGVADEWEARRAFSKAHPDCGSFQFGRCKSRKRWFWCVQWLEKSDWSHHDEHGWSETEEEALAAARATIERLADGGPATATLEHRGASMRLKEINAAERAARGANAT